MTRKEKIESLKLFSVVHCYPITSLRHFKMSLFLAFSRLQSYIHPEFQKFVVNNQLDIVCL